ncbi:WAP four-disulfide core domain protein 3-like isoform X1 [Salvelinus fontinalis]|uniref:WAP four-disulfide core domain protein 3-like isoform X1 n=2 Tax=Salvelinus fontinalis TaxID=8038 RepID=UPI00248650EA|nr:WAP four-disulfide core domain protein 3-like isoform X1 [Salvelinus fontinalis]
MDMNLSARCALVLSLLAFVHLKIVSAAETGGISTAKPGVCPRRRWGIGICAELCSKDSDCPNDEKCCHNGCGHVCIAPYTAKPGMCPRRRWGVGTCAELCSDDSDCPNDEKCCHNGCGHVCIAPYTVPVLLKAGQCPLLLKVVPSHKGCVRDEDCPKDDKCCVFHSDALCVPPDFTKPGVCPRRRWGVGTCAELCSNDSDCPNDEKCCHNGCGHDCIAPYTVPILPKAGQCPLLLKVLPSHKGCVRDEDCPKDDKCCVFHSDALCVPPDFTKPGVCPRRRWGSGICAELCSNDSDCPNDEKCCHNGCGHDCFAPTQ